MCVYFLTLGTSYLYAGVSLKTQELYALVFASRYLDILTSYISLYNTIMKLIFLGSSFSIVWYMRYHKVVRRSYDKDQDTFRHYFLVLPCLLLALLINEKFTFREVSMPLLLLLVCNWCDTRLFSRADYALLYLLFTFPKHTYAWNRWCGHFPCIWKL